MTERVILVRHGETEWSIDRRHTGRTDIPLTAEGRRRAAALAPILATVPGIDGAHVLTSPLARARETCALAGLGDRSEVVDGLAEWDYGEFEGRRTVDIRQMIPDWSVWTHPVTGGEDLADVAARVDGVLELIDGLGELTVVFAHAHLLRILAARWCGLAPRAGQALMIDAASISVLAREREARVIQHWNLVPEPFTDQPG